MSCDESDVVICRACMEECIEFKNIYRQGIILGELTTLAAMLAYCTNLEFQENEDFLPSNMCIVCIQNLAKLYAFKQTVERANEILRNQHGELQNIPTELEEYHDLTADDNADEQKQMEIGDQTYVALTVIDDLTNDNDVEELKVHSEIHEVDSKVQEVIYGVEEADHDSNFKEDDDYETEYEITFHDEDGSVIAQSVSASEEIEYDVEQNKSPVVDIPRTQATNKTIIHSAMGFRQIRAVKPRVKNMANKPIIPHLQCQVCGKQLSNANSFRYHMQLHSDATPFLCSECGVGFKTRNAYEGHMSIHDPNNPNTCEICGKTYRQASSLRSHMLIHTGEKPFQCDICGKGMTQKSGYKKHMLIHTGEKPHSCDICGREFRYSSNLIAHKRYHTGDKPFDCAQCDKCFPTSEQLKRHTLVHTGERPFSCDLCDKRFNRRSVLTAHRQTHVKMARDNHIKVECEQQPSTNIVEVMEKS